VYGLESCGLTGEVFQRVLLPVGRCNKTFQQLVASSQSPPEKNGNWFSPNHAWGTQRRTKIAARIPWLNAQLRRNSSAVLKLPAQFLTRLFTAAARNQFPVRTMQYHPAFVRTAVWTPKLCELAKQADGGVEFFHDDGVGLHLLPSQIGGVWIWKGQCTCCGERHWSVEVADSQGQLGLAIVTSDEGNEHRWRELLYPCLG
jgi:hypothetical protein